MTRLSAGMSGGFAGGSAAKATKEDRIRAKASVVRFMRARVFHIRSSGRTKNVGEACGGRFRLRHPARMAFSSALQGHGRDGLRDFLRLGERWAAAHIRRRNAHKHEV